MVQDLKAFLAKIEADKELQQKLDGIIKTSTQENVFANCNAVAAEMGYTIKQEDLQAFADEYKSELSDNELDKVAGGTVVVSIASTVAGAVISGIAGLADYMGKKSGERNK